MGQLIEFYKPKPKPPAPAPAIVEDPERMTADEVLEPLLKRASTISDILVLMADTDGQLGFVTNLEGMAESLLFMARVKHRVLSQDAAPATQPPAPGRA